MPKSESRHGRPSKASAAPVRPRLPSAGGRRIPAAIEPPASPRLPRATAVRLAAEVERLERELAGVRSQMAALAARAEVDPLTDVLNRRGFQRELKRSLA